MKKRGRNRKRGHGPAVMLAVFAVVSAVLAAYRAYYAGGIQKIQEGIAGEIIRFHVRANSDSEEDQALKLKVKAAVIDYIKPRLENAQSIDESRMILENEKENISATAVGTLRALGSEDDVYVYFETSYFPMKSYGDITFPPGEYEAFRVDIGEAKGNNWWCVLYPPLCFVDAVYGVVPDESKQQLKNTLTEEEYESVTGTKYVYRFKYLKFLNKFLP